MMGKFKVGDRVTHNAVSNVDVEQHWNKHFRLSNGEIIDGALVVVSVHEKNVGLSNKDGPAFFYMPPSKLKLADAVPAKDAGGGFKVGDKIRLIKFPIRGIRDIGEVFVATAPGSKYDGVVNFINRNGLLTWAPAEYFELVTTLSIEAGKFYKTRDGRKVGPMVKHDGYLYHGGWHYGYDGHCGYEGGDTLKFAERDLIAEWVDEPIAQPAKASNDNAAPTTPKFKVGDRVKVTTSRHGESQLGKTGVVINDNYRGGDLTVEIRYDTPMLSGLDHNQYSVADLELVTVTPAIVALIESGMAKPATRPKVHADQASATTEAERLALQFPGQQFGVFVLADSKIADVVNVPTVVLRAA